MSDQPDTLLEQAAAAREQWRAAVEAQADVVKRLRGPYDDATARLRDMYRELQRAELALSSARRAHAIGRALADAGIETDDPPLVVVEMTPSSLRVPRVFALVAVAPDGTGLYRYTPERSHRYQGREHAVLRSRAPEAPVPRLQPSAAQAAAGLLEWQERGAGDFGAGTGTMKPKRPPNGGRWRWLKIRDQEELLA